MTRPSSEKVYSRSKLSGVVIPVRYFTMFILLEVDCLYFLCIFMKGKLFHECNSHKEKIIVIGIRNMSLENISNLMYINIYQYFKKLFYDVHTFLYKKLRSD